MITPVSGPLGTINSNASIGIPGKSGVSGVIYAIIPNYGCITVYAPPLDKIGNSVRGVEFFKRKLAIIL